MKEVLSQTLWVLIQGGKAHSIGLSPLEKYGKKTAPIIETTFKVPAMTWRITDMSKVDIKKMLVDCYQSLIKTKVIFPGRYGDWMKCTLIKLGSRKKRQKILHLDLIGTNAWPKPTLAADLGIFIRNKKEVWFACITRSNDPGKGMPALIGGIMNAGKVLDSSAYTILKETEEEGNLRIDYDGDAEDIREDYLIREFPVLVKGFDALNPKLKSIKSKIHFVTRIPTPEAERNPDGNKRVYTTDAYTILIEVGNTDLSKAALAKIFQAGDDAAEMFYKDVTDMFNSGNFKGAPTFGMVHHTSLFKKMLTKVREIK